MRVLDDIQRGNISNDTSFGGSSMRLSIQDLFETFRERAQWTNEIIETGLSERLPVLEETITDVNLLDAIK